MRQGLKDMAAPRYRPGIWRKTLGTIAQGLPTQCLLCARWPIFSPFCTPCLQRHSHTRLRCARCALPLPDGLDAGTCCAACLQQPMALDACWAAVDYAPPWRGLVLRWKLGGQPALAHAAAQLMLQQLPVAQILAQADVLLPIPPSAQRARWRGFHHTLLLAQALLQACSQSASPASQAAVQLLPLALLRLPEGDAQHQAQRSRTQRLAAMKNAFILPPAWAASVQGKRVLLLDDVMTTGATLHSAALCLRLAGAAQVQALVLARTDI